MTDFKAAFKGGLDAANSSYRQREEIKTVLAQLTEQVYAASSGNVSIDVKFGDSVFAYGRKKDNYVEIATLSYEDVGYPIAVRYAKTCIECADCEELEAALAAMLEHPATGRLMLRVMAHEPIEEKP